jgi:VWFA-related protein
MTRRGAALILAPALGLAAGAGSDAPQATSPITLSIVTPTPRQAVNGRTAFAIELHPADAPVREVVVFVDGERVCRFTARPFTCSVDLSVSVSERTIRVVADLASGQRLVQTERTAPGTLVLTATAEAVVVPVHVIDGRDRLVGGLDVSRFRLFEDGVPQDISAMLVEDVPLHVLLALDVSGSMNAAMPQLRTAAAAFLQALRPIDRVTLGAFNANLFLLSPPAVSPIDSADLLIRLRASDGTTAIFDSLIRGVEVLKAQPGPRALVLFTDGDDKASHATAEAARTALQTNNVALYVVALGKVADDPAFHERLATLATETGGAAWFTPGLEVLQSHFAEVVKDLTGGYVLAYAPKRPAGDGAWRQIAVELVDSDRGWHVRAREGYLAK